MIDQQTNKEQQGRFACLGESAVTDEFRPRGGYRGGRGSGGYNNRDAGYGGERREGGYGGNRSYGGQRDGGVRSFGGSQSYGGQRDGGYGNSRGGFRDERPAGAGYNKSFGGPGREQQPKDPKDITFFNRGGRRMAREYEEDIFRNTCDKTKGINFDSYDSIDVDLEGSKTRDIKPLDSFKTADQIPECVMANIIRVKYDTPTPVQKYAIPILGGGRDLMACAQTGSGKTAAFLFPIICKMLKDGPPESRGIVAQKTEGLLEGYGRRRAAQPVALVLSPTRELTIQIAEEAKKFCYKTGVRTVVVFGGADIKYQISDLDQGCDICVATPGRLLDLIDKSKVDLGMIEYLVLDEADRMLDMGFAPQIQDIVLGRNMPVERQTAMFSATFPREIQNLAASFMDDYIYLTVGRVGSTSEFIKQTFVYCEEFEKPKKLLQLLAEATGRVLVFVETKKKADVIEEYLNDNNISAVSIHGDKNQNERNDALHWFKSGRASVLVATDVAARGLDIHSITWVINLDLPHSVDDYVHRVGRTGRAGNNGLATSFVNESNRTILRDLHRILEEAKQTVPSWLVDLTRHCTSAKVNGFGQQRYGGSSRGGFGGGRRRNDDDFGGNNNGNGGRRGGNAGGYKRQADDAW